MADGIAVDSIGGVLVSDSGNHRVTYYLPDRNDALLLFGQPDFTQGAPNNEGISETSIFQSIGIAIADMGNNRILQFPIINTILRNQTVVFPNGGVVARNSTLDVKGELLVEGTLLVDKTTVNITQDLQIDNSTLLKVQTDAVGANVEIVVARYASRSDTSTFSAIELVGEVSECNNVRPVYGLNALVLLADCGSDCAAEGAPTTSTSCSRWSDFSLFLLPAYRRYCRIRQLFYSCRCDHCHCDCSVL
jgi:hypothetical protein